MAQEVPRKFTLKLSGSYGSISGGDLNGIFNGINELLRDVARLSGATIRGELENAKWGFEFDEELIYNITDRVGLGLGVGYIRKSVASQSELRIGNLARFTFGWEPVFKAVPVVLSGHYHLPIASKLNAFARAGAGYYFATLDYKTLEESELYGNTIWSENEGTAKKSGLGFQGGLGLEYDVSGRLALYVEASGRSVSLKDWDVKNMNRNPYGNQEFTGTFWYADEYDVDTGKYYPTLELGDKAPSGPSIKNARKAEISLSGMAFKMGVIIRF
jgi:opacity protein-like surface antigen